MQAPQYRDKPFGSIRSLARALGVSERLLSYAAAHADSYYHPNKPEPKPDGTFRQHYRVDPDLKRIQDAIKRTIFGRTIFPSYLTGGIRDPEQPRDYVTDAKVHAGRRFLLTEDIKTFFPSVHPRLVRRMWQNLYHMPPNVADLLTKLTTYRDTLPQGAPTSTYIGNLILWDEEPQVVARLESLGFQYTRYVDNIAMSSDGVFPRETIREITSLIYGMLYSHGLRPKRRKRTTSTRRQAQTLHGLNLNSGRPTLPKKTRAHIWIDLRSARSKYDQMAPSERDSTAKSLAGKAAMVIRFHPSQGAKLGKRVELLIQDGNSAAKS